jgi:hypothetical protein
MDITVPPFEDLDDDGNYIGNDINFLKKDVVETISFEDYINMESEKRRKSKTKEEKEEEIKSLQKQIQELKKKSDLLDYDLELDYLESMNDTSENKFHLFMRNCKKKYDDLSLSYTNTRTMSGGIDFRSFFPKNFNYGNGFGPCPTELELLGLIFEKIFKNPKYKVVNKPTYKYNEDTGEILGFTDQTWVKRSADLNFDLFLDAVTVCSGKEIEKKPNCVIRERTCYEWQLKFNLNKDYKLNNEDFINGINNHFSLAKEVHFLNAYFTTTYENDNMIYVLIMKAGTYE